MSETIKQQNRERAKQYYEVHKQEIAEKRRNYYIQKKKEHENDQNKQRKQRIKKTDNMTEEEKIIYLQEKKERAKNAYKKFYSNNAEKMRNYAKKYRLDKINQVAFMESILSIIKNKYPNL